MTIVNFVADRDGGSRPQYPIPTCKSDEFECQAGFCINRIDLCNGRADCPDGRDERNCTSRRRKYSLF